jgi:hypothetical protein
MGLTYYRLVCKTCSKEGHEVEHRPLRSTDSWGMLAPDYDAIEKECGHMLADSLRNFHREHSGHDLEEKPEIFARPDRDEPTADDETNRLAEQILQPRLRRRSPRR